MSVPRIRSESLGEDPARHGNRKRRVREADGRGISLLSWLKQAQPAKLAQPA